MKFSIGYQLPDELDSTLDICRDHAAAVSEVYFPWGNEPSGRSALCGADEKGEVESFQLAELKEIRALGIRLALLLNANCYGEQAVSQKTRDRILSAADKLKRELDIGSVTTASPFLAYILKQEFGADIAVRASVNMRVGTVDAMEQLAECFDGYYMQREKNRDFAAIRTLKQWCDGRNKTLHLLVNSGCMRYCAFQTFHDNMVAHESGIVEQKNMPLRFPSPCWDYLSGLPQKKAAENYLHSTWIRPEDIVHYEPYFAEAKLATRMHQRPRMVVAAYARGRFTGNMMDLTEPSYSTLFRGKILDNTLFPKDWFEKTSQCDKNCAACGYCACVAEAVLTEPRF
ncbi:MAG: hypothetical protein IJ412_04630 [Oscillospiraceae bacterium]|nr:hypothetical protein [Oscillospiraceae bacterium]